MSLINCRECGAKVSDSAKTCPSCGIENPSLNLFERIGGEFSKIIGFILIILGLLVWLILPFGSAIGIPLIIIGLVMYYAPQFGFVMLVIFAVYSSLGDLNQIASTLNSFIVSEFLNSKTLGLAMAVLALSYYEYDKANKINPLDFLGKPPIESITIQTHERFIDLSIRINALQEQLDVAISSIDASSKRIVLSQNSSLFWTGCVFILDCEKPGLVKVDAHSKIDNYVRFFSRKSFIKLVNIMFSLNLKESFFS